MARGFQFLSLNVSHRNWTTVGALDGMREAIVDQRGLLCPYDNSWSIDVWLQYQNQLIVPSRLPFVSQSIQDYLPILSTEFDHQNIVLTSRVLVEKIQGEEVVFNQ
ncbi:MAG: hypothetical protein OMM_13124, partial [Candidatus Magnetoglobus multicellularis str. Araruama]